MNRLVILGVVCLCVMNALSLESENVIESKQKAVLITGASSGIGLKITEYLSANDYIVYAGARKQEDLERLNKMPRVHSIRLDVTSDQDIAAAVEIVEKNDTELYALINNAGVGGFGPIAEISEADFHFVLDVNLYGGFRVTKAFVPLLKRSKGRILFTGSLFGLMPTEALGAYGISKHALEAYADVLAKEMSQYGVSVSVVEPGSYKSKIYENTYQRLFSDDEDVKKLPEWQQGLYQHGSALPFDHPPPDKVAEVVLMALADKQPQARYIASMQPDLVERAVKYQLYNGVRVNGGYDQPFSFNQLKNWLKRYYCDFDRSMADKTPDASCVKNEK